LIAAEDFAAAFSVEYQADLIFSRWAAGAGLIEFGDAPDLKFAHSFSNRGRRGRSLVFFFRWADGFDLETAKKAYRVERRILNSALAKLAETQLGLVRMPGESDEALRQRCMNAISRANGLGVP
jgi:hypothetical protein